MSDSRKRVVIYTRVNTSDQKTDNHVRDLRLVAERRGWDVVEIYSDEGISGAKGRDKRPDLDRLLDEARRRKFDVVMAWAIDRLGRSLIDLLGTIQHLEASGVDLYLDKQGIDTTTPMGKLLFQVTGAFAEFERTIIKDRIKAGMARINAELARQREKNPEQRATFTARKSGIARSSLGRPGPSDDKLDAARAMLATGAGIIKTAKDVGLGVGTVHKLKRAMAMPDPAVDIARPVLMLQASMPAKRNHPSREEGRHKMLELFDRTRRAPEEELKRLKAAAANAHADKTKRATHEEFMKAHEERKAYEDKFKKDMQWQAEMAARRKKRSEASKAAWKRRKEAN